MSWARRAARERLAGGWRRRCAGVSGVRVCAMARCRAAVRAHWLRQTSGSRGDFKIAANEVAIGLTMPRVAAATLRHRLTPSAFQRAVTLSEYFDVESALSAGFFDELVEPCDLMSRAEARAEQYRELDERAHTASKRRIRRALIRKIRYSIPLDLLDAIVTGLRSVRPR